MKRYLTELVGTFFLVFSIGMTVSTGATAAPIAVGIMLMAMVYMGRHVSGAHYNPAVTIALLMRGAMERGDLVPYIAAQLFGAWLAAGSVYLVTGTTFAPSPGAGVGVGSALMAEVLVTFALALVILHVATTDATEGNSYYGLAIGGVVTAGMYATAPISGGAFNPAVGVGPMLVDVLAGTGSFGDLWLYLVGPIVGATLAVPAYRLQTATTAFPG